MFCVVHLILRLCAPCAFAEKQPDDEFANTFAINQLCTEHINSHLRTATRFVKSQRSAIEVFFAATNPAVQLIKPSQAVNKSLVRACLCETNYAPLKECLIRNHFG
eukprot:2684190-Amphidinium_carterae.2